MTTTYLSKYADGPAVDAALDLATSALQTAQQVATAIDADATAEATLHSALGIASPANTFWDDLDFAMTFRTNTSDNPPVWTQIASTGVYAWAFENNDTAHFQRQVPHAFKVGQTSWRPHVHWMPTTSATYAGTWTLTLTGHKTSSTPSEAPLITTVTRTGAFNVNATAWRGHLTLLNDGEVGKAIDGSEWGISMILFAKLTLTLTAGASCVLSGFDLHGEIDAPGSNDEYVK